MNYRESIRPSADPLRSASIYARPFHSHFAVSTPVWRAPKKLETNSLCKRELTLHFDMTSPPLSVTLRPGSSVVSFWPSVKRGAACRIRCMYVMRMLRTPLNAICARFTALFSFSHKSGILAKAAFSAQPASLFLSIQSVHVGFNTFRSPKRSFHPGPKQQITTGNWLGSGGRRKNWKQISIFSAPLPVSLPALIL